MNWKRMLLVGAGALALFWPGVAQAQSCNDRIRREERDLDSAIRRHGYFSRQAQEERRELDNLRYACGGDYRYNGNYGYYGNDRRFDRDDDRYWRDRERRERDRRFREELREERREHRRHHDRDRDRDGDRDDDHRR